MVPFFMFFQYNRNMKSRVKKVLGDRKKFTGVFEKTFSDKDMFGNKISKIILKDIKDENNTLIKDEIIFNYSNSFEKIELHKGDKLEFIARMTFMTGSYIGNMQKVTENKTPELKLVRPTKIIKNF